MDNRLNDRKGGLNIDILQDLFLLSAYRSGFKAMNLVLCSLEIHISTCVPESTRFFTQGYDKLSFFDMKMASRGFHSAVYLCDSRESYTFLTRGFTIFFVQARELWRGLRAWEPASPYFRPQQV